MNLEQARQVAEQFLDETVRARSPVEIAIASTAESEWAWVFGYNTVAYVEGGNPMNSLIGNCPIVVDKQTGRAELQWSARSERRGPERPPALRLVDPTGPGAHARTGIESCGE
ncbi:MAG: YrhB domain-containing protein [Actinomycetota bacterium]